MRRNGLAPLAVAFALACVRPARAESFSVPIPLQGQLLAKVAEYDRNLPARAGETVRVLLVAKTSDPSSMPAVRQMQQALAGVDKIAGLPHEEIVLPFANVAGLLETIRTRRISIVYLGPGLRDEIDAICTAVDGVNVLTASAIPGYVAQGVVLGFDLVSGKPKLLVHLPHARRQKVALEANVLKLVRIYE